MQSDALQRQSAERIAEAFREIKKAVKTAAFNRHDPSKFTTYFAKPHQMLSAILQGGNIDLKLEVSTLVWGDFPVLEDDDRENNLIYPLWQLGTRLLTFKPGLEAYELQRFCEILVGMKSRDASVDLLTALWKEDFLNIDWVVMTDFAFVDDQDAEEVEVEVEKVLSYLNKSLQTAKGEGVSFARVSVEDLELKLEDLQSIRQTRLEGVIATEAERKAFQDDLERDERFLLEKICTILFQVMELPATESEFEDQRAALEQVLDGLILQGKFRVIEKVLEQLRRFSARDKLSPANRKLAQECLDGLLKLMHEAHRIRAVATALNTGATRDLVGVRLYLGRLGQSATILVLDLLDTLNNPAHRRAVADVLVEQGTAGAHIFAGRLKGANSQLAKELLYIINKIDPPDKLQLFRNVLEHENAVLRMEGLSAIGQTKTKETFDLVHDVFRSHEVPQMRAHAARLLATFPADWSEAPLLDFARSPNFSERPAGEQRAIFAALVKLESAGAQAFIGGLFQEKGSLLTRRKVDETKTMALNAMTTVPSIPTMQLLAQIAQDTKNNSKEICEAAKEAALAMRSKMLGGVS